METSRFTNHSSQPPTLVSDTTPHYDRVREFMLAAGQSLPSHPCEPSADVRVLRAKLILEECLETINKGLGVNVLIDAPVLARSGTKTPVKMSACTFVAARPMNIVEVADGVADVSVVSISTLIAFGIKDRELLEEVDAANLRKFGPGSYRAGPNDQNGQPEGKWVKSPDFVPPDVIGVLLRQDWEIPLD